MYLDLLKRALRHELYWPPDRDWTGDAVVEEFAQAVREAQAAGTLDVKKARAEGRGWPKFGQTMVGEYRLDNVQQCIETVIADGVQGDLIETGVWRGGVTILMRAVLAAHDIDDRMVFVADSFRGLPPPNSTAYPADEGDVHHAAHHLAVSREQVETNFRMYGLLDDQVEFLEGWFSETLPTVADRTWAVIRLDGDMYESTMDGLVNLYSGLAVGGFLIIDDFAYAPCRQAIEDFRAEHSIVEAIETVDWTGAYWRRAR
jgi:hypothetical protein